MIVSRKQAEEAARFMRMQLDDATEIMVNTAYKSMAKTCHPDAVPGKEAEFVTLDRSKCILLEWLKQPRANKPSGEISANVCPRCHGSGKVQLQRGFQTMTMICGTCRGSGELVDREKDEQC